MQYEMEDSQMQLMLTILHLFLQVNNSSLFYCFNKFIHIKICNNWFHSNDAKIEDYFSVIQYIQKKVYSILKYQIFNNINDADHDLFPKVMQSKIFKKISEQIIILIIIIIKFYYSSDPIFVQEFAAGPNMIYTN
ncbi:unnamed protein product [Paramecium sonneborni]|uniref:Transmembrane protein n=1 Tax=Paramecium sonneborni TaxID=65129 RepID=A0A8S1RWQ7_9CILI|nr:unnamed protein product [Paramecium sonneborni]